jgi:hypothetical protein
MFTYAIYNFILFGSTWAAYLYEKSESKNSQVVFLLISFFIPFLFLAIRYDVGQDYHNYVEYFYKIARGEIVLKEPGYLLVNYIIADFGLDVQWLFVFFGFFTMLFVYKALPKDGFALGIFLFIVMYYFLWAFTSLRETLAMSIMFYASKYIYQKNFFAYFLWFLVAMMFHVMISLLLLIIYPFANKKTNRFFLMMIIIILFLMVQVTDFAHSIIEGVVLLFPKYAWYLNSKYMLPAGTSAGLLGPIIKLTIGLIVIFFKEKVINKYSSANVTINLYILSLIGSILLLDVSIFSRLEIAYVFFFILSIVYFIKTFNKETRIFTLIIVSLFYYLILMRYVSMGTANIENGIYLKPYRTIFNTQTNEHVYMQ